ncbi:MAG: transporter substrate-binding domain-containing protein [Actinomycetota bacterium]
MAGKLIVALGMLALAFGGACVPPEESNDIVVRFDEDTLMGRIQERGELIVALPELPPFARGVGSPQPEGFLVDLAEEVAAALGVEATYVPLLYPASAEEAFASVDIASVDVSFPPFPITEALAREHKFSTPYYVGHQRVLSRRADADLAGLRVCQALDATTGVPLERVEPGVETLDRPFARCARLYRGGQVDAVSASDLFLLGLTSGGRGHLWEDELTTEGFGPAVPLRAGGFGDFVSAVIIESKVEGRWMAAYERWLADAFPPEERVGEPPTMTVSEAAALHPANLE